LTDLTGYAKKSTANGDTRSVSGGLCVAVSGRAADADPPRLLTTVAAAIALLRFFAGIALLGIAA
jgi:hypothetical protein